MGASRAASAGSFPFCRHQNDVFSAYLRLYLHVCLCVCLSKVGRGMCGHACVHGRGGGVGVGRCWKTEAQLCSLIFWERSGGVVDPPAPFSSAGSRRISAAASLHKATLCNLPPAHKYNCNQERREGGGGTVDSEGTRRKRPPTVLRLHQCRWRMTRYVRAPLSFCTFLFLHLHMCLYANVAAYN